MVRFLVSAPEASIPSGSAQSVLTPPECPSRRAISSPVVGSHSPIVRTSDPEASLSWGSAHSAVNPGRLPREPGAGSMELWPIWVTWFPIKRSAKFCVA